MCKVMAFTNLSKTNKINGLGAAVFAELTHYEKDGFGYAIQGAKGIFGERTLNKEISFPNISRKDTQAPFLNKICNRFGSKSKAVGGAIYHGRTSTNTVNLLNTHPIIKHGWTLVHNGVVTNHGPAYQQITTNDTEHLVEQLGTVGISGIEEFITGYYAIAAFDPQGALHIIRDGQARLYCAEIPEWDTWVFSTLASSIENVCEAMEVKHSTIEPVNDNVHLIFVDNKLVHHATITPRGWTYRESSQSYRSLGRTMSDSWNNHTDGGDDTGMYPYGNGNYSNVRRAVGEQRALTTVKDDNPNGNVLDMTAANAAALSAITEVDGNTTADEDSPSEADLSAIEKSIENAFQDAFIDPNLVSEVEAEFGYKISDDMAAFFMEIHTFADHTYKAYDYKHNELEWTEFMSLSYEEQSWCTVVRPDGTIVDPLDFHAETLYSGMKN